ncbi:unnamed protein product, partial [Iphiclides podalirius]
MKITVIIVAMVLSLVCGEDDGRYRPDVNANYGRYRYSGDGSYYNPFGRYNNYFRNNARYQNKPYQELLTPYNAIAEKSNPPQVAVTYRPIEVKTTTTSSAYTLASKSTVQPTTLPVFQRSNLPEGNARIVSQDSDFDANNYRFSYLTENGISAGESGVVEPGENAGTRVTGFYEYIGADGLKYRIDYTADENGFHPSGAHLP